MSHAAHKFTLTAHFVLAVYKPVGRVTFQDRPTGDAGAAAGRIPRWVRNSLIVAAALALLLVMLYLHGGHGPAMHAPHGV